MAERIEPVLEPPVGDLEPGDSAELEYAGFWSRFAALIVDNAVVTILGLALLIAAGFVGEEAVVVANLVFLLAAILYWPLMESSERQATIGKQLLGIQVVDANGARLTFVRALLRNLAKIISSLPFGLGFLLAAFTAKRQALHDMITKCLVVRAGPSRFLKAVIATVGALLISILGGYYYFTEVYLPQMAGDRGRHIEKGMKQAQQRAPVAKPEPVQPPVAKAPAPAPAAQPAPAAAAPSGPKPMTPQEIAEFEKKMQEAKPEPAKVASVTPPAKPAAVAAAKPKPEPKPAPVAVPKPKPVPAPAPAAETPAARAPEPPAPAPPAEPRAPAAPVVVAPGLSSRIVQSPKFNDVMTCVMFRDAAALAELLELGWWVDRPDSNGLTPLMAAAWNGDAAMTQLLLKAGADPNRRAPRGSVLDYAERGENALVIQMLRSGGAR